MSSSSNNTSNYHQEVPISSFLNLPQPPPPPPPPPTSTSLFDPHLPSYLPTFRSSPNDPSSSSLNLQPPPPPSPSQVPATRPNTCNSKKRSRASRRAPTTVLTTDTSNFRAMVQEFTGFPAPPFPSSTSSPPFPLLRPRLHLLTSPSSSHNSITTPLSRPFQQKIPTTTPNSSLVDAIHANITCSYPFVNHSSLIGGPLNIAPPQFGDLGSLIAASEAMQSLPSWAADRQQEFGESSSRDHQDGSRSIPEHDQFQPEKRQKTD